MRKINTITREHSDCIDNINFVAINTRSVLRKVSKIRLHEAVVLENREMKMVYGGSGIVGGRFRCHCFSLGVSWEGLYATHEAIAASIQMNCGSGGGTCTVV